MNELKRSCPLELEKIRELAAGILDLPKELVTENADFTEELGADSLELFRIVIAVEEAFGVEIPAESAVGIRTSGNAAAALQALSGIKQRAGKGEKHEER